MVNLEVVQRAYPVCRPYVDRSGCRSCQMLKHVRGEGDSTTLCGVPCSPMDGWAPLTDWHPEDVDAVDRCWSCFKRLDALAS